MVSDTSFPPETSPKWMAMAEELQSLPIHTLPLSFFNLTVTLSCMYFFILSFYLTTGLPLLRPSVSFIYTFFTNSPLFFLSIWPNHLSIFFSPIPLHHASKVHKESHHWTHWYWLTFSRLTLSARVSGYCLPLTIVRCHRRGVLIGREFKSWANMPIIIFMMSRGWSITKRP